jgi:restriction endonuclease S subunit
MAIAATCNQSMAAIEPVGALDGRFLYWWLNSNYLTLRSMGGGDLRDGLNLVHIASIPVPMPEVVEQRQIADYLDVQTAKIDTLIGKQERLIETLAERRQAVIGHAVTKGVDANAPTKDSGIEWIGEVPAHWEVRSLRHLVRDINVKNEGLRSLNYLSLMANIGVLLYADKGDVGNKAPEDLTKCKLVARGDFVINSMNYGIGSYGISPYDGICSPVYIVLRASGSAEVRFVGRVLEARTFQRLAQSYGNGILEHRRAISWDVLKNLRVPVPPAPEQLAVAIAVDHETSQIDALAAKSREMIDVLKERRQALISAAVTGKIDVRGPT